MGYTLTQSELTRLRSELTRAIKSGDSRKVQATVASAYAIFEQKGWPDDWSRWQRAEDDFRQRISPGFPTFTI
jgi:hypothetical protein